MFTEFLIYDLKVAVLIAVFYFCFRLLMERDTMHRVNRVVLLMGLALSLMLPLCVITLHKTVWLEAEITGASPTEFAIVHPTTQPTPTFWEMITWQHLLALIVIIGMVVRLVYIALSYRQLRRLLDTSERHTLDDGTVVAVTDESVAPFSWMQTVVMNRKDYEEHNPLLLIHERSHIKLRHSWDVVFVELLTILQWFNPVVWLLSRDLRTVHEYEADEEVLSQGYNTAQYISLLMTKATGIQACALANGINTSETKKRIDMMIKRKSPRLSWLKGLYIVPVAALSLAMTAKTVTDYRTLPTTNDEEELTTVKKDKPMMEDMATPMVDEKAIVTQDKPFALHAVVDQFGRITGFTHEGEPDPRQPLTFPIGYIFIDGHEATLEEAMNYKSLEWEIILHNPNTEGDPKWNYKDKQGILSFKTKKSNNLLPVKMGPDTDKEPLIVIDGKVATAEQMKALDPKEVDNVSVIKNEETKKLYAKHFNADTSNGIIFINTKEYVKKGGSKELVSVKVNTNKPKNETTEKAFTSLKETMFDSKESEKNKDATTPTTESATDNVFDVVEEMPAFPGGIEELMKFLSLNIKYPVEAHEKGIQGRVIVTFIIEKDGQVSSPRISKTIDAKKANELTVVANSKELTEEQKNDIEAEKRGIQALNDEAIRVINVMPKWKPGKQNGKVVRVKYSLPISFRLQ